jgi:UDP-2,3-diacylglucosamine hydrolase
MHEHFFVSDLHLFSRRSQATLHDEALRAAVARARTFVLGGDIFDFRWSVLGSAQLTVDAAVRWLRDLIALNEQCQFHFVLGNHDYNRAFIESLDHLSAASPNLFWHRHYLRLHNSLFLHGDVVDSPHSSTSHLHIRRQKWLANEQRGELAHWLYELAMQARLHKLTHLVNRHRKIADRLLRYANHIGHGPASGLEHVYFGHTHRAMAAFPHGGLLFHNGGAPMCGLEFRIVPVSLPAAVGGSDAVGTTPQ